MLDNDTIERLERRERLDERRILIKKTSGFDIWLNLWTNRMSYLIFIENNRLLKLNIKLLNDLDLWSVKQEIRMRLQRKLVRDIHNTISSGFSFEDHLFTKDKFNPNFRSDIIALLFRYLRNYLIHNDTFPLNTKMEWDESGIRRYQGMTKEGFLCYLKTLLLENQLPPLDDRKEKKIKQINKLLEYLSPLSETINFEPLYEQYFKHILKYRHNWLKQILRKNRVALQDLLKEIEEYDQQLESHINLTIASLSEGHKLLMDDISILTKYQKRYLQVLLKKMRNKNN